MDVLFLIGRILFAAAFLYAGAGILKDGSATQKVLGSGGGVKLIGLASITGALMIAFGVVADLGAILVAAGLLLVTPLKHAFWTGPAGQRADKEHRFMRNVTLLGATIIIFWIYNQLQGDVPLSLTDPLINTW